MPSAQATHCMNSLLSTPPWTHTLCYVHLCSVFSDTGCVYLLTHLDGFSAHGFSHCHENTSRLVDTHGLVDPVTAAKSQTRK